MKFKKFPSLVNTYKEKTVSDIYQQGLDGGKWVVLEKIDGANFGIYYNGVDFRYASRNQFVDDAFFNCGFAVDKYKPQIEGIYQMCGLEEGETLIIRGELFGKGIQNRVYYGEGRYFRVFEVSTMSVDGKQVTLPLNEARLLLHNTGVCGVGDHTLTDDVLKFVPVLKVCCLQEALEYSPDYRSLLTPEGHEGDNWSEGVTIVPNEPKFFYSRDRVFFKNKSDLFSEKKTKKQKVEIILDDFDAARLEQALAYITESRVLSALSKIGPVDHTKFGATLKEVMEDLHRDFEDDQGHSVTEGTTERKKIKSELQRAGANAVREVFKTLI